MDSQEVLVCEKHKKKQKNLIQIPSNYYICMNRYCPNAYSVLCNICKLQHRDHQMKILTIQDIGFLIQRLLKLPFKQAGIFIIQSVQILKKLKLVNQFTWKIRNILTQLQKQTIDFINITQNIISQYAQCKNSAKQLSQIIMQFETKQNFYSFRNNTIHKLNRLDYNMQKDIIQYGNLQIKQKQDTRKKTLTFIKTNIEEVKQYTMKIIEVILNNDDDEEEEEDILQKKKNYQILKADIINLALEEEKKRKKKQQKNKSTKQIQIQTQFKWIQFQNSFKSLQSQLQFASAAHKKMETQNKIKIQNLQKQKQALFKSKQMIKRQKQKIQKNFDQKCQFLSHYEHRLRDNHQKRNTRCKQREQVIKQLIELIEYQRIDSCLNSPEKQNRNISKPKKN